MIVATSQAECYWWGCDTAGQTLWTLSVRHHNQVYDWASVPIQLDSLRLDAMETEKKCKDVVCCQKLHGLNLTGAKPKPLFL